MNLKLGLVINFGERFVKGGFHRVITKDSAKTETRKVAEREMTKFTESSKKGTHRGLVRHESAAGTVNQDYDVVVRLIDAARRHPGLRGFTRSNLLRMRQFHDTYRGDEKVAPLVRQLPWTHNLCSF